MCSETAQVRKTYTGKLYGRQDDLIIALQLALIGATKFWQVRLTRGLFAIFCFDVFFVLAPQDPKYRGFRANDYLTPQGLAEGPRL